jgi:hypothetical protein
MPSNLPSLEAEAALDAQKAFEALSQATPETFEEKLDTWKKATKKSKELSTGPHGQRLS